MAVYLVVLVEGVDDLQNLVFEIPCFEVLSRFDFKERDRLIIDHQRDTLRVLDQVFEDF